MKNYWDTILIGSGMGGLACAAILAKEGKSVLVLEKGTSPGGCCSSFSKAGFVFEAGATTLVGFEKDLPLDRLEKQLGIQFPKRELPISMQVHLEDDVITRYTKKVDWVGECIRVFGNPIRQTMFWNFTFFLASSVWNLADRYKSFPFRNLGDYLSSLFYFRWKDIIALLFSFITAEQVLYLFGLGQNKKFKKFISEQLMITNQCRMEGAPFLSASAGLTYPNLKNYYVEGGMVELPKTLIHFLEKQGSEYRNKSEVLSIRVLENEGELKKWEVRTKNEIFYASRVISNVPIWNLNKLFLEKENSLQKSANQFEKGIWGAITIGIALRSEIPEEECLHHQIHLKEKLPFGAAETIFVSISHEQDQIRSSKGIRILSISTHVENPEEWKRSDPFYQKQKTEILDYIVQTLENTFDWFKKERIEFTHIATPATWFTWTGREHGRVGGIPASYFRNPFRYLSPISKIPNLYMTGDTIYPGQGIPAVCLGGMNLANQILKRKRD